MTKNLITVGAIICGMAASSGCNSITANYHDPSQEATLYAGTQRILAPREGQMETVGSLPNAIDLPLTLVVDTIVIPINLVYIFTGYEPNVKEAPQPEPQLKWVRPSKDGDHFVRDESGARFVVWGVNYDHDRSGRLIEDYWNEEWSTVVEDFKEMKSLGANVVRVHLQTARFIKKSHEPNRSALRQLARLVKLAEQTGLYLNITGLGCYHKNDVPEWYDAMDETERWELQALFWGSVAETCAQSPAVFCYDLMNEPILPGAGKKETDWLAGAFAGSHFVQRITLDLAGRSRNQVAKAWIDKLVSAIRLHDDRHMITVGVIPWAHHFFPNANQPIFYSRETDENLDFTSVHFYPEKDEVSKALEALAVYDVGKPLVIEEMFPLKCSVQELSAFIDGSRKIADGWISFYWGKTIEELVAEDLNLSGAITKNWLEHFRAKAPEILETVNRSNQQK